MNPKYPHLWRGCAWVLAAGLLAACAHTSATRPFRRVLVADFEAMVPSASHTNVSTSVAEWVTASLVNTPHVSVIDREGLDYLYQQARRRPDPWRVIGRLAQADYLVVGSVSKVDRNFIIQARIFSVRTGKIVPGSSVSRSCDRLEDLYPATQALTRVLGLHLQELARRHLQYANPEPSNG